MTASEWNVLVTETAYQDLREAAAYMRDTLLPPKKAAKTFIDAFEEAVVDLSTFPEGRPLVSNLDLAKRGHRWTPVGRFMLFYTTNRDAHTVVTERLLYGPRDWAAML